MGSRRQPTDHVITFAGAGTVPITDSGKYVRVIEATDTVYIKLDDISTELVRGKKSQVASEGFDKVVIRSAVAQTVVICISDEPQDEGRDDVAVTTTASITPGNTFEGVADVPLVAAVATLIVAADAARLSVTVKNPSTNTKSIRIGGAGSVGVAQGFEVEPGEHATRATTDAVYGYSVPGETISVDVVREL